MNDINTTMMVNNINSIDNFIQIIKIIDGLVLM